MSSPEKAPDAKRGREDEEEILLKRQRAEAAQAANALGTNGEDASAAKYFLKVLIPNADAGRVVRVFASFFFLGAAFFFPWW